MIEDDDRRHFGLSHVFAELVGFERMKYLKIVRVLGSKIVEVLIQLGLGVLEKTENVGFGRLEHVSSELLERADFFRLRRSSFLHKAHDVLKE